jgi:hypothetical protein
MLPHSQNERHIRRIKGAMHDLIKRAGGIEAAAAATGYSKTQVGRWHSLDGDDMMPFPVIVALEKQTGSFFVTEAMCAMHSLQTVPVPSSDNSIAAAFWGVEKAHSELVNTVADAFSDKVLTVTESRNIDNKATMLDRANDTLRSVLAGIGNKAVKVFG